MMITSDTLIHQLVYVALTAASMAVNVDYSLLAVDLESSVPKHAPHTLIGPMSTLAPLHLTDMASPALSPDDSSLSAAVSISPSDSENLSPDELELLNKLEEQNRSVTKINPSPLHADCVMDEAFADQLPELNLHFRSHCFHTSMYASSWFLTLFLTTFPLPIATRVFDIFIYEGLEVIFRVGMALLTVNQTELMQLDMEGMSQYFQKVIPHQFDSCPDKLIHKAYQVKYNPKRMKRLEKEYAAIKSKEMEEQIEIKRLRTENRLLKQRIETLEKESAALADRLIQGQVTRAQEAEENYAIKRELAVVKQQYYTATENLQSAQNVIRQLQDKQNDPHVTEELVSHLESELEQSRLREAETLGALKEMQEKVVELEKRSSSLPDENNIALLQEELQSLRKREAHALQVMREGQKQVTELSDRWQSLSSRGGGGIWKDSPRKSATGELQDEVMSCRLREVMAQSETRELRQRVLILESQVYFPSEVMHEKQLSRLEKECKELRERLQSEAAQYKALQTQMSEDKRRHAVTECKNKEEVMAVRLREADSMAAVAEMRQRIAELEIQKEEGVIKGKLNDSDSSQYIRELKDQIEELRQEILIIRGHKPYSDPISFDGLDLSSRSGQEDEDSLPSSDEELLTRPLGALQDALYPHSPHKACFLRPLRSSASSDSEEGVETNGGTSDTPPEPAEEE
ncbi:EVI5-like protein [Dendropsophus ebraccatus]|uniref:EVI5-like protein n=1 Tax=Dendropsophus ebraccatus TaxID=150705 RepID=UPI003831FF87